MPAIVPRWEWRTFGDSFGPDGGVSAALDPERCRRATRCTCSRPQNGDTVKVRDELMDVKHLEQVERRRARAVAAGDEGRVPPRRPPTSAGARLARRSQAPPRSEGTRSTSSRRAVRPKGPAGGRVHKRRQRYTVGGCTSELTDVRAVERSTRTIAVERRCGPRDRGRAQIGLECPPNTSFRAAQGAARLRRTGYAVIDVGTNSVKFHIGRAAGPDGSLAHSCRAGGDHRLGEGREETGALSRSRWPGRSKRSRAWSRRRRGTARCDQRRGNGRVSNRREPRGFVEATQAQAVSRSRSFRARTRAASATSRRKRTGLRSGSLVVFDTGGGSSSSRSAMASG